MSQQTFPVRLVHKSLIKAGDTIVVDGVEKTVCKKDIKRCDFMGITIFGDAYMSGRKLVERVEYPSRG